MKKLTMSEWQEKYIAEPIERFDQKYQMFNRPLWDPEIKGLLKDWNFSGEARERPGHTIMEHALQRASWSGTQLALLNASKPNTSSITKAIMSAMVAGGPRMSGPARQTPERPRLKVDDPQIMAGNLKKAAVYFGADLVGICRTDRRWLYSHTFEMARPSSENPGQESKPQEIPEEYQYTIVMGFEEDYELMKYATTDIADATVGLGYSRMAIANNHLSAFIRNLGYRAIDCSTNDVALSIPMAMQAGLGEIGRNGLLITPRFGPRLRLSKVITDLPLSADSPIDFGVTEFCNACMKCASMCPSRSITTGERSVEPVNASNSRGALVWRIDAVSCRMYWSKANKSCSMCVACCPYNKVDNWFHRSVRWFTDYARWADSFYVTMDDLLGYGKPKKAGDFWKEWQPKN
jgi:epoxyqueuosine reductase